MDMNSTSLTTRQVTPPGDGGALVWSAVLGSLKGEIAPEIFSEYLRGTHPSFFDGRVMVVEVPSLFHRTWIIQNALDRIYEVLDLEHGYEGVEVDLHVAPDGQMPAPTWERPAALLAPAVARRQGRTKERDT